MNGRLSGGVKSGPARVCSEFRKWGAGVKKKDTHTPVCGELRFKKRKQKRRYNF